MIVKLFPPKQKLGSDREINKYYVFFNSMYDINKRRSSCWNQNGHS
jgi:hypothetical protein